MSVEITEAGSASDLNEKIASIMASESVPRERRGKKYDLRPLIEALTSIPLPEGALYKDDKGQGVRVFMRLTAREGATGRPEEVLDALGIPLEDTRIERTKLIFQKTFSQEVIIAGC